MILRRISDALRRQDWTTVVVETLIVTFGVLLGLQLNNWNEDRVLRERERTFLQQILIDLESDAETSQRGVIFADQIDDMAEDFLAVIEGTPEGADVSDADLMALVPAAGYAYLPYSKSTTYNEMVSTGGLSLIRDVELKRALGEYYDRFVTGRQWDDLIREEQYAYRAAIRGVLTRQQFAWARDSYRRSAEERAPAPAFDRAAFEEIVRARPEIADSLNSMGAVQERLRNDSHRLGQEAGDLSDQVRAVLGR